MKTLPPVEYPRIDADDLPAHLRALASDLARVGSSIRYYGGFSAMGQFGNCLETQIAKDCDDMAQGMEDHRGNRA